MPMIGPFTTPPITMAASSIPGRYLCVLVDHFRVTQKANLITNVTPNVTAPKKSANILVRKA